MKTTSRKIQELHLARPAAENGWEIWSYHPSPPHLVRTTGNLSEAGKTLRLIAVPTVYLLGFARWLQTNDETLLPDMVRALVDREGLSPKTSGGESLDWKPLVREENRTLVSLRLLTGNLPDNLALAQIERYESSVDLLTLPTNGLVLWHEDGRLAAAFIRNGTAFHLQSFASLTVTPEVASELLCTRLQLETEEVLTPLETIELHGTFSAEEKEMLASLLDIAPVILDLSAPKIPAKPSPLVPSLVGVMRQKAQRRQRIERVLVGVAVAYAVAVIALILSVGWLQWQKKHLRDQITTNRPTVETIRTTAQRWRALESAVRPSIYPLEILFQSAQLLPPDGVRFTLFEQKDNRVTIRGEANDAAAAFKLVEDLKNKAELNWFDWQMPRPNILPNDKAEFQIQGTPPDAPAN